MLFVSLGSISFAKTAHPVRKPSSGSRVGSSTLRELSALSEEEGKTDIAKIQGYTEVKKIEGGRINLVLVDGGGSTDIGSLMASSNLYLSFFKDGEEQNMKSSFYLGGVNSFKVISKDSSSLKLSLECKDDKLKDKKVDVVVNFSDFEKSFVSKANSDGATSQDLIVAGKVTISNQCLPDLN